MNKSYTYTIPEDPKMLKEALCLAQGLVAGSEREEHKSYLPIIQHLIDECDRKRPLYPNGKHGDLHTSECGCEDEERENWDKVSNKPHKRKTYGNRVEVVRDLNVLARTIIKYNAYECDTCKGIFVTVDIHEGVTPMFSPCFKTEYCRGRAHSLGYPSGGTKPPERLGPPILEWYRPDESEIRRMSHEMQQHIRQGGLARRATKYAPDWVKGMVGT
jgi:hypothetical protein